MISKGAYLRVQTLSTVYHLIMYFLPLAGSPGLPDGTLLPPTTAEVLPTDSGKQTHRYF